MNELELAALTARYYRAEIGRLMQQAEHWMEKGYPLAVNHRVVKADNYFQIVALMEQNPTQGFPSPFETMRASLSIPLALPHGAYPPRAELHRFSDPVFVAAYVAEHGDGVRRRT